MLLKYMILIKMKLENHETVLKMLENLEKRTRRVLLIILIVWILVDVVFIASMVTQTRPSISLTKIGEYGKLAKSHPIASWDQESLISSYLSKTIDFFLIGAAAMIGMIFLGIRSSVALSSKIEIPVFILDILAL